MNLYIWLLMGLRVYYGFLLVKNLVDVAKNNVYGDNYTFFWMVFAAYVGIRVMFSFIVMKVLATGHLTNDQKFRIVYETYR